MTTEISRFFGADHPLVPLVCLTIVKLRRRESHSSTVPGYATCIVPATGSIDLQTGDATFAAIGQRRVNLWDGAPEGVCISSGAAARIGAVSG